MVLGGWFQSVAAAAVLLGGWQGLRQAAAETASSPTAVAGEVPVAETPEVLHHFGFMQQNEVASHTFIVRNTGNAPLELQAPQGSCRCLKMRLPKRDLAAGEEGEVWVQWRAAEKAGESFKQTVRVPTNDPERESIDFVITGEVGGHIALAPSRVEWVNARRGKRRTASVRISSSYWKQLHIGDLQPSMEGLELRLAEAPPAVSSGGVARATRDLVITAPAELTGHGFDALVTMRVSPTAKGLEEPLPGSDLEPPRQAAEEGSAPVSKNDLPATIQIPVSFELAPAVTVVGAGVDEEEKRILMGIQRPGEEVVRKYLIKVQDEQKTLALVNKQTTPRSIEVGFEPYRPEKGLYRLQLRLPPDSLDRGYIGKKAGKLELEFDHPRIKRLEFALEVSPSH